MKDGWVLVTGASAGIGRALALGFSRRGRRVVLVGRNQQRLDEAAEECRRRNGGRALVLPADLSKPGACADIALRLEREKAPVDLLVNNAGFGVLGNFVRTDLARELDMVQVGVSVPLDMTKRLLPAMIDAKAGGILNVGSVYCFCPVPEQAVYGATKAFLLSWSLALAEELRGTGVRVSLLCPGATASDFRRRAGVSDAGRMKGMTPEAVAEAGVEAWERGDLFCVPGLHNRAFVAMASRIPTSLRAPLLGLVNRYRGLKQT